MPQLTVRSELESLATVRAWMADQVRDLGLSSRECNRLQVAVGEAITNVIRHAYGEGREGPIHLSLLRDPGALSVEIRDLGRRFHWADWREPDLDEPTDGGYGVFLMRRYAEAVEFAPDSGVGNLLRMRFRIPASETSR